MKSPERSFQTGDDEFSPEIENNIELRKSRLIEKAESITKRLERFDAKGLERWERELASISRAGNREAFDEGAREALNHVALQLKQAKEQALKQLEDLIKKNPKIPFVVGLVAALGEHAPLVRNVEPFKSGIDLITHPEAWGYDAVYKPQSEKDREEVKRKIAEREARSNPKALEAYRHKIDGALERGEHIPLKEIVFEIERLSGVPEAEVAQAREKMDQMIAGYVEQAKKKGKIDQEFLNGLTGEMYGGETVYNWGEGTVTTFINKGIRSCESVDVTQEIIIEESIAVLPETAQAGYRFGSNEIRQHVRTVVTIPSENISKSFLLDGHAIELSESEGDAPTMSATVDAGILKKSFVTSEPIIIDAKPGAPGETKPIKTLIDFDMDKPLKRNIQIRGDLRSSDSVNAQLKKDKVEPVYLSEEAKRRIEKFKDTATKEQIIEVTFEHDELKDDLIVEKELLLAGFSGVTDIDLTRVESLSKESIKLIEESEFASAAGAMIRIGETGGWSDEALESILKNKQRSLVLYCDEDGAYDERITKIWDKFESQMKSGDPQPEGFKLEVRANAGKSRRSGDHVVNDPTVEAFGALLAHIPSHFSELDMHELGAKELIEPLMKLKRPMKIFVNANFVNLMTPEQKGDLIDREGHAFVLSVDDYVQAVPILSNESKDSRGFDVALEDLGRLSSGRLILHINIFNAAHVNGSLENSKKIVREILTVLEKKSEVR